MLDLTIVSSTPPSKAVASTPNGSPPGDFSRALADADDNPAPEPDPAAVPTAIKQDGINRQDIAADGKEMPKQDDQTIDPALINLMFLVPVPVPVQLPAAPAGAEQAATGAIPTAPATVLAAAPAAVTPSFQPTADPQAADPQAVAQSDQTASAGQSAATATLPVLAAADATLSPDMLKAFFATNPPAEAVALTTTPAPADDATTPSLPPATVPQPVATPDDRPVSTDRVAATAILPTLDGTAATPPSNLLSVLAAAKAPTDAAAPANTVAADSTATTTTIAVTATATPAQTAAPVAVAANVAGNVAANAVMAGESIVVPARRGDKTDQPSGQRATLVTPTLASLASGLVDGPVIGLVQPAARAFASAIAATTAGLQRDPRDPVEDSTGTVITQALGTATHELTATVRDNATLDTRGAQWREALVDHIETLRDAADARDTRIRLVPDALGKVDVAIRKDGDTVNVRFTTETPAARQLLVDARPQLAALAEARGLKIGQTSVDSGAYQGGAHQNGAQGNGQQRASDQPIQNRRPVRSDTAATTTTDPAATDGWIA